MLDENAPRELQAAHRELAELKRQVRQGGRFFWTVIPALIGIGVLVLASTNPPVRPGVWLLCGLLLAWAGLSLAGFHLDLPARWGGQRVYERIAYLEGFIAASEKESSSRAPRGG